MHETAWKNKRRGKAPRNWRQLKRHPLSAEYVDLKGRAWQQFRDGVKDNGILNRRKITLYEGQVLDGWQLQRACVELGIRPEYQQFPKGKDPEAFVEIVNDHRRHETQDQAMARAEKRRQRVATARASGKSQRAIAEEEGVSLGQVQRDLARSGDSGESPEPTNGVVVGRDGKTYEATKPADPEPWDGAAEEEEEEEPEPAPRIPQRLQHFFGHIPQFEQAARLAVRLANLLQEIEQTPAYKKAVEGKRHKEFSTYVRSAGETIAALTPQRPCPECGGEYAPSENSDPCTFCGDKGYQTAEEVQL